MGLQLTSNDQVLTLAPDSSSAAAGKKLANAKSWQNLGQNADALWGECQGSALYQVRVDLSTLTITCSCPSRKLPCKHGLGLLLLAVSTPKSVPHSEPPEWVTSWLAKRAANSKRKASSEQQKAPASSLSAATIKNAEKRQAQMMKGLDLLDLWLNDVIRNGLASVESAIGCCAWAKYPTLPPTGRISSWPNLANWRCSHMLSATVSK
jgi:SWIM zinc finger